MQDLNGAVTEFVDARGLPMEKRAQFAAYLRATHNMSQVEIGRLLGGLSQPHVSRLLAHAEKAGYLVVEHRFRADNLSESERRDLAGLLAPSALTNALGEFCTRHGRPVPGLGVFESGPGSTQGAMAQRRKRFGKTAAGRVIELLGGQKIAGIAWGRTIHAVIEGIAASHLPLGDIDGIEIVPVCAELLLTSQRELSSSRLVEQLTRIFRTNGEDALQLTGFPAYVPRHYEEVMQQAAWRLIRDAPNYERIFSGPDALVARMDVLMTSVGFSESPVFGGLDDLLRAGRVDFETLRDLVVGDLGGLLIVRPDATEAQNALIDELNRMWTGISLDQVADIAARAHEKPATSGVIVLALRAERAKTLLELIRRGLVNQLVIDHDAAAGLERCLADEMG